MDAPFKLGDRVRYGEHVGTVDSLDQISSGWAVGVHWDTPRQHANGSRWEGEVLYDTELEPYASASSESA